MATGTIDICGHEYSYRTFYSARRWHAKIWRGISDVRPLLYSADTQSQAFEKAIVATEEREQMIQRAISCPRCKGLGWYVGTDAQKHLCRHDEITSPSFPNGLRAETSRTEDEAREQISWARALDNKAQLDRMERALGNDKPIFKFTT